MRTPKRTLAARIRELFDKHGGRMTLEELYRLAMQAEVVSRSDLEAFAREDLEAAIARALTKDPRLSRQLQEEGVEVLDDPLFRARLVQLIEEDLEEDDEKD